MNLFFVFIVWSKHQAHKKKQIKNTAKESNTHLRKLILRMVFFYNQDGYLCSFLNFEGDMEFLRLKQSAK